MSKAQKYFNQVLSSVKEARKNSESANSNEKIEEALSYRDALKTINAGEATASQARLIAMWWLYRNVELTGEYNSFVEFVEQEILIGDAVDTDKIRRAMNVTTNILQWAHSNPIKINGERIDAEAIILRDGLDGKLRNAVGMFAGMDNESKARLLRAIWTCTQDELRREMKAIRNSVANGDPQTVDDDIDPLSDDWDEESAVTHAPSIVMKKVYLPNDKVRFVFDDSVDLELAATIEMLLEGVVEFESESSAN